jgi:hypothetical protein
MGPSAELAGLRAVVITLRRRPDRLAAFREKWDRLQLGVPLSTFFAVDGGTGGGDAGCKRSHHAVLSRHPGPLLVLEDDACFAPEFTLDLDPPGDWEILWLGAQHHIAPDPVDTVWARPRYQVRTHAYIARDPKRLAAFLPEMPRLDPYMAQVQMSQYVLRRHTVGQSAGRSDIDQRTRSSDEYWNLLNRAQRRGGRRY